MKKLAEVKENVQKTVVWVQLQWTGHVDSTGACMSTSIDSRCPESGGERGEDNEDYEGGLREGPGKIDRGVENKVSR